MIVLFSIPIPLLFLDYNSRIKENVSALKLSLRYFYKLQCILSHTSRQDN